MSGVKVLFPRMAQICHVATAFRRNREGVLSSDEAAVVTKSNYRKKCGSWVIGGVRPYALTTSTGEARPSNLPKRHNEGCVLSYEGPAVVTSCVGLTARKSERCLLGEGSVIARASHAAASHSSDGSAIGVGMTADKPRRRLSGECMGTPALVTRLTRVQPVALALFGGRNE